MYGLRPTILSVIQVVAQRHLITDLKFDRDFQGFRHERRVMALLVRNQTFEDLGICSHASVSSISNQDPTGASSHGGRIKSAAHQYTHAVSSQPVRDGTIFQLAELLPPLATPFPHDA